MKIIETQTLLLQLQAGDLDALGVLYDRFQKLVFRTALGITGDPNIAADLLQDVFLRLHRFSQHVDATRPLEPWLYRVTTNLAYTWAKRQKRWMRPLDDMAEWLKGKENKQPAVHVERDETWLRVQHAIQNLPPRKRVVVSLYYLNELPISEIAGILNLPIGTVKSRLYYGREMLKKTLGYEGELLSEVNYEFT